MSYVKCLEYHDPQYCERYLNPGGFGSDGGGRDDKRGGPALNKPINLIDGQFLVTSPTEFAATLRGDVAPMLSDFYKPNDKRRAVAL